MFYHSIVARKARTEFTKTNGASGYASLASMCVQTAG